MYKIYTKFSTKNVYSTVGLLISLASIAALLSTGYMVGNSAIAQEPFPPTIFLQLRDIPSYTITIPFSELSESSFSPSHVSIPRGMTVIWFNDDDGEHTVTTLSNSTYSPPEKIDSGPIVGQGGSFIHKFTKDGVYDYSDQLNPAMHGRIYVTSAIEKDNNMNMLVGGKLPFNPQQASSMVLSFVPTNISYPPDISMTYNVSISNSTGKPIFSHVYDDDDGILDIELVPTHSSKNASKTVTEFTTWGPDFIGQEAFQTTGTFHIRGPVLVENSPYNITVSLVSKDNQIFSNPILDTFTLRPQ
jgi:Plastocyanin